MNVRVIQHEWCLDIYKIEAHFWDPFRITEYVYSEHFIGIYSVGIHGICAIDYSMIVWCL